MFLFVIEYLYRVVILYVIPSKSPIYRLFEESLDKGGGYGMIGISRNYYEA